MKKEIALRKAQLLQEEKEKSFVVEKMVLGSLCNCFANVSFF